MSKKPSIVRQVLETLDRLEAFGTSRHSAKAARRDELRAAGHPVGWSHSTGRIHSYKTKEVYKEHCLRFVKWARANHGVRYLEALTPRLGELSSAWLDEQIRAGMSPYTLQTARAAVRMLARGMGFSEEEVRKIAADVEIPIRRRESIQRSRGPVAADRELSASRWQGLIDFLRATGLRRREVAALRARDVLITENGMFVHIRQGKGGKSRFAPVLPAGEAAVLEAIKGLDPDDRVFKRIPVRLDVHSYRREYAQRLYQHLSGRDLPPAEGRLRPGDYDRTAAAEVSRALGHNRVDVVTRHYLR